MPNWTSCQTNFMHIPRMLFWQFKTWNFGNPDYIPQKYYVKVLNVEKNYMNHYVNIWFGSSQGVKTGEMRVCSVSSTSVLDSRNLNNGCSSFQCCKSIQLSKRYRIWNESELLSNTVLSGLYLCVPIVKLYLSKCFLWQAKTSCYANMIYCTES